MGRATWCVLPRSRSNSMEKEIRLYNVIFPVWMLLLFPQTWLLVLPGNFLVDSLVLLLAMIFLKMENKKQIYQSKILPVWLFGLLADMVGTAFLLLTILLGNNAGDAWYWILPAVVLSAVCIFLLDYFVTFRKIETKERRLLALAFAVFTAPYTFFIPTGWIY